jgi:hypothetical protein
MITVKLIHNDGTKTIIQCVDMIDAKRESARALNDDSVKFIAVEEKREK